MKYSTLSKGESWMSEEEKSITKQLVRQFKARFTKAGLPESSELLFRLNDVIHSHLLVRRMEAKLGSTKEPKEAKEPKELKESKEPKGPKESREDERGPEIPLTNLAEAIGKARERMRKAMRELELVCGMPGTPVQIGIADVLAPLMRQTRGVDMLALDDEEPLDCE